MKILVTGCAGFIGSNFIHYVLGKYPHYKVYGLDLLTYAGNLTNLNGALENKNFKFIKGDINNRELVEYLFEEFQLNGVIHFAAESHVDNSILNPEIFLKTNVLGTFTLLDVAYKFWMHSPFKCKKNFENARFLHISTDEVYGELDDVGLFTERTTYAPNSPYSASKASSDFIARAYFKTYGLNLVATNCSNNYGPRQHREKLIPTIIRNALAGNPIPIYGNGKNIRDWLFVDDHCSGVDLVFHEGLNGEFYNIGGRNEKTNIEVANHICNLLDALVPLENKKYSEQIRYVQDRAGHDKRYAIDATKIETELGWRAKKCFETGIVETVKWYLGVI